MGAVTLTAPIDWAIWLGSQGELRRRCPACRAEVRWARWSHRSIRMLPLDADPVDDGPLLVIDSLFEGTSVEIAVVRKVRAGEQMHPDRLRYARHELTCPERPLAT